MSDNQTPDRPTWPPIEQDWGYRQPVDLTDEPSVRLVPAAEQVRRAVEDPVRTDTIKSIDDAVTAPLRSDLAAARRTSPATEAKVQLLNLAACHAERALESLTEAVDWYAVVDNKSYRQLVADVEGLVNDIAYRLRVANE